MWSSMAGVIGCKTQPTAAEHAAPSPLASASAAFEATLASAEDASAGRAPTGAPNLLQTVPAKVAVSSTVDNPRDFPEHLMDGRMETAWNGKTGDLHPTIAFRVPADAHVERVDITAGYDAHQKSGERRDLFTANHRIKTLAVHRNGKKVKEVALDPQRRGFQPVPIDMDGGDFQLEVVATEPGTNKEWKEIVVSEMRVIGRPGKELRKSGEPLRIAVGGLDAPISGGLPADRSRPEVRKALADICAQYIDSVKADWVRLQAEPEGSSPITEDKKRWKAPFCTPAAWSGKFQGDATWKSVSAVRAGYAMSDGMHLVVELSRGFALAPIEWADAGANLTGCPSVFVPEEVPEVRVDNGRLLAIVDGSRMTFVESTDDKDDGSRGMWARGAVACRDTGAVLDCADYNPQYQEALAFKIQPKPRSRLPFSSLPWTNVKKFHVGPDLQIVIDP